MKKIARDEFPTPSVSDHAVLRYLERARGVDVEGARRAIGQAMRSAMAHGVEHAQWDGVRFIVKDGTVITALDRKWMSPFFDYDPGKAGGA